MQHKEFKELFAPYLDGLLSFEEKKNFEAHLEKCPECKLEIEQLKQTMELFCSLPEEEPPFDLAPVIKGKIIAQKLNKQSFFARYARFGAIAAAMLLMISLSFFGANLNYSVKSSEQLAEAPQAKSIAPMSQAESTGNQSFAKHKQMSDLAYDGANQVRKEAAPSEHKIIKNADISITIDNYRNFTDNLNDYLAKHEGYIENSSVAKDNNSKKYNVSLIIRIPLAGFQDTITYLQTLGELQYLNMGSSDVTNQYIDTSARIDSLQKQINALNQLVTKAKDVDEILKVQNELARVQSEHDALVNQINFWDRAITYATISANVQETSISKDKIAPPNDEDVISKAKAGFIKSVNNLIKQSQKLFIELVSIIPQLIILILIVAVLLIFFKIKKGK